VKIVDKTGYANINICSQCGACIGVCPTEALERDANGVVQVRKDKCTSCLMCVGFCPTASLLFEGSKQTEPFKCISCGICGRKCPTGALELLNVPESK
ncbi:4Fe-4S binding protein, partial [Synergistaceae bacterium OttesenSCG-928-D05]|nr:4Fe-4S binding protein [Synergistaceae bacterium OttesenSCG-928-D05]